MIKPLNYLIAFLFCFLCNICFGQNSNASVDSIFVEWNGMTYQSLVRQSNLIKDSLRKLMYQNRLSVIKEYWDITDLDNVNTQSIRYKFLNSFSNEGEISVKNCFVVESNIENSAIEIRIFTISSITHGKAKANTFIFSQNKWIKKSSGSLDSVELQNNLTNYIAKYPLGINEDDVIITQFKNGKVVDSEYYLYGTLSVSGGLKQLIKTGQIPETLKQY